MKHKFADLLIYAAHNADAKFEWVRVDRRDLIGTCQSELITSSVIGNISDVLNDLNSDWHIKQQSADQLATIDSYNQLKTLRVAESDGEIIQLNYGSNEQPEWRDIPKNSCLIAPFTNYRIKPEKIVRWLWANKDGFTLERLMTNDERINKSCAPEYNVKLEWSRTEFEL